MPVKVSETTSATSGLILSYDLEKMKNTFIHEVDLIPLKGREAIIKKYSVAVMKDELKDLITYYENNGGIDVVRINLAVHIRPMSACNGTDYADSLTVVIEAEKFKASTGPPSETDAYNRQGEYVVIPGYNGISQFAVGQVPALPAAAMAPPPQAPQPRETCCPSTNP